MAAWSGLRSYSLQRRAPLFVAKVLLHIASGVAAMCGGDAILGIFLATYSSKGDYLPLRYPLTSFDYEYTKALLKEARARKGSPRTDDGEGGATVATAAAAAAAAAETEPSAPPATATAAVAGTTEAAAAAATAAAATADAAAGPVEETPTGSERADSERPSGDVHSTLPDDGLSRDGSYLSVTNANPATPAPGKAAERGPGAGPSREEGGAEQGPYMEQSPHGFDPKFLAQLFSPRPSMSDQRFQVAVDNVLFVGHPLRDDPKEKTHNPDYYDAEQDETETMSRLAEFDGWKIKSDPSLRPGSNQQGTRLLADLGLISLMLNREPSETGDSAISEGERAVRDSKEWKRRGYYKRVYPKLFHIVFMLDNTIPGIEELADRIYYHVLRRLTKALMIEQVESNHVITQSRLIRTLNDRALADGYTAARYLQEVVRLKLARDLIELYNGLRKGDLVNLHVNKRIMLSLHIPRGPPLERALPTAAAAVSAAQPQALAEVHAEGAGLPLHSNAAGRSVAPAVQQYWRPIVFSQSTVGGGSTHSVAAHRTSAKQLPVADGAGAPSTTIATARELQPGENNGYPHIEPYHALLLLEDVDSLRRRLLYSDASPTLLAVVEKASPTRSLLVLHTLVDCSFAQLCRFVAHLVYWGIARLICPVNLCSTYVPACTSMPQALVDKFGAQSCGLCTLPQLFAAMHPPRPAAQVLEELVASKYTQAEAAASSDYEEHELDLRRFRPEFRNMLVLLLGEGAIAQLHTWPVVLVPNYVKLNLSEEQFVHMSFLWFRSLYTEHPDLLGAFPRALLNRSELQCWAADEGRDQVGIEIVQQAIREAEGRVVLCRIMRKLALRKVRESWSSRRQGKHGKELQCIEQQIADEEDKVHTFCNRVEKAGIDTWMHTKAQREAVLSQARQERVQARRACGKDIGDAEALGRSSGLLYKWYDLVKKDPDLGEFTREIVSKYVSFVPTDAPPHRTEAERRYLRRLVRGRASEQQQDWFDRHVHLFTGSNHLVKLLEVEQTTVARLEAMLREFDGIIMLPQHL